MAALKTPGKRRQSNQFLPTQHHKNGVTTWEEKKKWLKAHTLNFELFCQIRLGICINFAQPVPTHSAGLVFGLSLSMFLWFRASIHKPKRHFTPYTFVHR
jgi:hypothetical protein